MVRRACATAPRDPATSQRTESGERVCASASPAVASHTHSPSHPRGGADIEYAKAQGEKLWRPTSKGEKEVKEKWDKENKPADDLGDDDSEGEDSDEEEEEEKDEL